MAIHMSFHWRRHPELGHRCRSAPAKPAMVFERKWSPCGLAIASSVEPHGFGLSRHHSIRHSHSFELVRTRTTNPGDLHSNDGLHRRADRITEQIEKIRRFLRFLERNRSLCGVRYRPDTEHRAPDPIAAKHETRPAGDAFCLRYGTARGVGNRR